MKRVCLIIFLILIGCGVNYKKDYEKGWVYWFSDYGMNNEGVQYFEYFDYGRNYESKFEDQKEAFETGFKDAFYFVNQKEIYGSFIDMMEEGYQQYYGN